MIGVTRAARSFTAVAATVSVLALAACGGDAGGSDGNGSGDGWSPERPVTFVVATGAGGGGDIFGRAAAAGIQEVNDGVKIGVENHEGGNEVVGATFALSHADDPHYIFVANTSLVLIPFSIDPPPDYTWESFTPLAMVAADQQMMVVSADSPYNSLTELMDAAKSGDEELRVGLTSTTGTDSAVANIVEQDQDIAFQKVILESGSESVTNLLAGNIDLSFLNPSEVLGQVEAGELKPLAVFGSERYGEGSGLEDVPTAQEQGVDVTFTQFRGLMAPGEITEDEKAYWIDALEKWTKTEAYDTYIADNILQPAWQSGDDFVAFIENQQSQFEQVFGG